MEQKKVVIIGGVAGGASAAARLRRLDEHAHIVVVERGPYISFANCGLPYYLGGTIRDQAALTLQTPESFKARFNVDVRVFSEAVSIQPDKKTIRFLYKGIIIKHNKTEPTYTKTSLFLCEKRRFFMARTEKGGNIFKLAGPRGLAFFHLIKKEVSKWPMKK